MKKNTHKSLLPNLSSRSVLILGTALPVFLYCIAYALNGVFPFGDKILLDADSFHQYLPFLTEFRRKLGGSESLFYSFSGGLGYNFWATIAYYAASPLNILILLFPEYAVCDFMVWITVVKVGLCGGIFAWYLARQNQESGLFAIAFGTMYAFSNYLVSYKYNIMWLDTIAVVPLVMYGLEKLVHGGKPWCYLFSLFYAIWCNFYIGYMVCLFSCLYLVFLYVTEEGLTKKRVLESILSFSVSSVLAGGMAAVLLVPAYLALKQSTAMVTGESSGIQFYNNIISMFRAHYMESESFRISYNPGDVHIYCGMAVLPLAALFFSDKSVRKKLRVGYAVFLGFLLFCFTFRPLNFMWHGFHNQTALPNRFSFLYNILLLKACYTELPNLKAAEEKRLNRVILGVFGVSALFALWDLIAQHSFKVTISLGCLALYTVMLFQIRSEPKKEQQFSLVLCLLMVLEAGGWGMIDLSLNGEGWERSYNVGYQQDFQALIAARKENAFYRSDVDTDTSNFITYVGGNGISLFNSTMQDNIAKFLGGMNLHSELNMVLNHGGTKILNDLLGVRYFVTEETDADTWKEYKKVSSQNGRTLYYNEQALSLGIMVPDEILSWKPEPGNGMIAQNELAEKICGIKDMYSLVQEFTGKTDEPISFDIPPDGTLYITLDKDPYELRWQAPDYSRTYVKGFRYLLLPARQTAEGDDKVTLTVTTTDGEDYTGKVYFNRDSDYNQLAQTLSANQMENVTVSGNHVLGEITAEESGTLLMTIPYNKGWRIKIDGQDTDYLDVAGALIGIPILQGTHQIEMSFTPPGFFIGCMISCISLAALIITVLVLKKYRNQK